MLTQRHTNIMTCFFSNFRGYILANFLFKKISSVTYTCVMDLDHFLLEVLLLEIRAIMANKKLNDEPCANYLTAHIGAIASALQF